MSYRNPNLTAAPISTLALVAMVIIAGVGTASLFHSGGPDGSDEGAPIVAGVDTECTIDAASDKPAIPSQPNVSITFTRESEEIVHVQFEYKLSEDTRTFTVTPRENYDSVLNTENLEASQDGTYRWTEEGSPSLTVSLNATDPDADTQLYFSDWMYEPTPRVTHTWSTDPGKNHCGRAFGMSTDRTLTRADEGEVAAGTSKFVLGTTVHVEERTVSSGETIRVLIPQDAYEDFKEANGPNPYEHVFDQFDRASQSYHTESSGENTIHVYVVPWTQRSASGVTHSTPASSSMMWIWATQPASGTTNPWVHEYIHTQQQFYLGEDMKWFKEASARYLEAKHGMRHTETRDVSDIHNHWSNTRFPESTLSDRDSWESSSVPYYKGGRVLFKLDQRLAAHSDLTMIDVITWMNRQPGQVTYQEFRRYIVSNTTPETGEWLDQHVHTTDGIKLSEDDFERLNETR